MAAFLQTEMAAMSGCPCYCLVLAQSAPEESEREQVGSCGVNAPTLVER